MVGVYRLRNIGVEEAVSGSGGVRSHDQINTIKAKAVRPSVTKEQTALDRYATVRVSASLSSLATSEGSGVT